MRNFLIGLGLGIAAGTMLAPASGEESRERLRAGVKQIGQRVRGQAEHLRQNAGMARDVAHSIAGRRGGTAAHESVQTNERGSSASSRLNNISREELMEVHGIGPVLADKIIQNRPYRRDEEVVERGIVPQSTFDNLRDLLGRRSA